MSRGKVVPGKFGAALLLQSHLDPRYWAAEMISSNSDQQIDLDSIVDPKSSVPRSAMEGLRRTFAEHFAVFD